jgi:hypothetical protein
VFVVGLALTVLPIVVDNPVGGLQLYEAALPLAIRVVLVPLQIVIEVGETEIAGVELIVTDVVTGIAAHPPDAGIVYVTV